MSEAITNGTILVAEDDEKLGDQIERFLKKYHYDVLRARDGLEAIEQIRLQQPDIVVLDLMMPGADGFQVCREVRADFTGEILMLTASQDDMDHVAGLEGGADGYLIKPVHPRVLLAHIRLLERKHKPSSDEGNTVDEASEKLIRFGKLEIHPVQRSVRLAGEYITLTPAEFDVLSLLAQRAEEVVSRDEILKTLRGIEYDGFDRSVDVKVSALRKKLDDNLSQPRRIITVRAKGYLFVPDAWS